MLTWMESYFQIRQKGSTVSTELLAGFSTFLALSYIVVVNPAILSEAGMDRDAVFFATIVASSIATLTMGLWARLPFALAPGMEMNAYVAFFVVGSLGFSWQEAMGAVFWSGIIFLILTFSGIRERIIDAIPDRMKAGLSFSVGVFLALIAFKVCGLLRYEGVTLQGLGSFTSPNAYMVYFSLFVLLILAKLRVHGEVLVSIVLTSLLCNFLKIGDSGTAVSSFSFNSLSAIGQLDISVITNPKILNVILILFLVDFYGSVAKFIGLTSSTNIVEDGKLPRIKEALLIDGAATVFGSAIGTSSITTYVESGVGIGAGGRTGLTAVVCGALMLACLAIGPLLSFVPVVATTGALLFVAAKLCPPLRQLREYSRLDLCVLLLMQVTVIATFAIDRAMLVGFGVYLGRDILVGRKPNPYLAISTLLLAIGFALQITS